MLADLWKVRVRAGLAMQVADEGDAFEGGYIEANPLGTCRSTSLPARPSSSSRRFRQRRRGRSSTPWAPSLPGRTTISTVPAVASPCRGAIRCPNLCRSRCR
jgi:hypothetical protein